eukprot:CAMPEP_0197479552 /NCGR_PEP_ID=MMETSP1309-20131121/34885_1 /TAXON_ID=464262 /ORGANISM="Genus nov. species nov., Strain RCC998" /LENGTH=31 /DNA_ID= /DNA_START= /DNA_END= /DNA_ORIENTATION=
MATRRMAHGAWRNTREERKREKREKNKQQSE